MRPRVAFFADRRPERMEPYMRGDWDALAEIADVTWLDASPGDGWKRVTGPAGWMPSRAVLHAVAQSDLVFQWFATPLAPVAAARLLGKPSIVVAGGYDVAYLPEIGYGLMSGRRSRLMVRLVLTLADLVLCVSRSTEGEVRRWARHATACTLYHGLDPTRYPMGSGERRPQVVTIGAVSREYLLRKGLRTFALSAKLLPEIRFLLVGKHVDATAVEELRHAGGPNLDLTGYLPEDRLLALLQESAVYAQLSLHEGFGYAVAEAMLCGCTPVASGRGALLEVVGDCGYYVDPADPAAAAAGIRRALTQPQQLAARRRIEIAFPMEQRRKELQRHVQRLVKPA